MITKITGVLNRVLEEEARIQVGQLEYQVLLPEFVRRTLQGQVGHEVTLYTSDYLEGNPMQGRVVPRLIGFAALPVALPRCPTPNPTCAAAGNDSAALTARIMLYFAILITIPPRARPSSQTEVTSRLVPAVVQLLFHLGQIVSGCLRST